ncbi:MAG: hypothetical protein ACOCZ6_02935 [Nanoarchaeota archaeon]
MQAKEYIEKVKNSPVYTDWINTNPDYYLVHVFSMTGENIQVGFYNKTEDKVVTFVIGDEITMSGPEESFKESGIIQPLETERVSVDIEEAFELAKKLQESEYQKEIIDKKMIILQNLEEQPVYNITLITKALNFINIKLSAVDGSVITHRRNSILDLKQSEGEDGVEN